MGQRQREWAKRVRAELIQKLGGKCAKCGETRLDRLQVDHIDPEDKPFVSDRVCASTRVADYKRLVAAGKAQCLCRKCNEIKGDRPEKKGVDSPEPF